MKKYEAVFWRSNPQLANGGYETRRMIEAKSIASARRQAQSISNRASYGGMELLSVVLLKEEACG